MYQNFIRQQGENQQDPFYQEYFKQHNSKTNKRLHIIGIGLALLILLHSIFTFDILQLIYVPIFGIGFAWIGHKFFQQNDSCTNYNHFMYTVQVNVYIIKDIIMRKRSF